MKSNELYNHSPICVYTWKIINFEVEILHLNIAVVVLISVSLVVTSESIQEQFQTPSENDEFMNSTTNLIDQRSLSYVINSTSFSDWVTYQGSGSLKWCRYSSNTNYGYGCLSSDSTTYWGYSSSSRCSSDSSSYLPSNAKKLLCPENFSSCSTQKVTIYSCKTINFPTAIWVFTIGNAQLSDALRVWIKEHLLLVPFEFKHGYPLAFDRTICLLLLRTEH